MSCILMHVSSKSGWHGHSVPPLDVNQPTKEVFQDEEPSEEPEKTAAEDSVSLSSLKGIEAGPTAETAPQAHNVDVHSSRVDCPRHHTVDTQPVPNPRLSDPEPRNDEIQFDFAPARENDTPQPEVRVSNTPKMNVVDIAMSTPQTKDKVPETATAVRNRPWGVAGPPIHGSRVSKAPRRRRDKAVEHPHNAPHADPMNMRQPSEEDLLYLLMS